MKKNILFVFAHYDDEAFSAGTIRKMVNEGHNVQVLIICGNGYVLDEPRKEMFKKNVGLMGCCGSTLKYFDLTLSDLKEEVKSEIKASVSQLIIDDKIDYVYTNHSGDLHPDHKIVSDMIRTACRPGLTTIKGLYECYISGATEYGLGIYNFNIIVDVTDTYPIKKQCFVNYDTHLKNGSSWEVTNNCSKYIGGLYNIQYTEMFKLIWEKQ